MRKIVPKYSVLLFVGLYLNCLLVHAQTAGNYSSNQVQNNWTLHNLFEQKVFIENNEGQFDFTCHSPMKEGTGKGQEKVLFNTEITGVSLYFTQNEIIYRYDKFPELTPEQRKEREHQIDRESDTTRQHPETFYFRMQWKGANPNVEIIAEDEVPFYYCYPRGNKHTTIAHAFKKLLYKNLYPGIDVEYYFPENKPGLEYSIIVNPGADLSLVKLLYPDAKKKNIDTEGNLMLQSEMGQFISHAPGRTYYKQSQTEIKSSFQIKEDKISFRANNYDHGKSLVIDPWVTNLNLAPMDRAYDLCYDLNGNIYVYGGGGGGYIPKPYQLVKLDNSGAIQWTFNTVFPGSLNGIRYGDFAVDENTGTCYLGDGYIAYTTSIVLKVNTMGIQTDSILTGSQLPEIWRMKYNRCINKIVIAGGQPVGATCQAAIIDTAFTAITPVNVLNIPVNSPGTYHDMVLLTIDNSNGYCYMANADKQNSDTNISNVLIKCPLPSLLPLSFLVKDGYSFDELNSINYVRDSLSYLMPVAHDANGMNGMAASPNWLYLYDGYTLKRFNKNNGALIYAKKINTTKTILTWDGHGYYSPEVVQWGGLDVDRCDNIYAGCKDSVNVYDSAMNKILAIPMVLTTDTVYDLQLAPNNLLYVCGNGFVSSYTISSPPPLSMSISKTPACSGCNGTATTILSGCGNKYSTYSYQWSDGQTTQFASGLCPGTYTVTVSTNCEILLKDTVTIIASSNPGINAITQQVNENCYGQSIGSASVSASGGSGNYAYSWQPIGDTVPSITNLSAGTYTLIVTDTDGCGNIETVNITQPSQLFTTITSFPDSCYGQNIASAAVSATGGTIPYKYIWNPGGITNAKDSGLITGSYTVNVTDSNGCTISDTVTIPPPPPPINISIDSLMNVSCYGINDGYSKVTVSGGSPGYYYSWNPPEGMTNQAKTLAAGTYTLLVTDYHRCSASINITITQPSQLSVNGTSPIKIYSGQDTTISASATGGILPYTFTWIGLGNGSNIQVSPLSTTTYTVQVTDSNGCSATALITVIIEQLADNIFIPNAFSPNGDGQNDVLLAKGNNLAAFYMAIYDRWGNKVFESNNINNGWDGSYNGKPMETGTYTYYANGSFTDGKPFNKKGNITLVR